MLATMGYITPERLACTYEFLLCVSAIKERFFADVCSVWLVVSQAWFYDYDCNI